MSESIQIKSPSMAAIIGVLVVVAAFVMTRVLGAVAGNALDMTARTIISLGRMWIVAGILVALVLYWEQRPLASIGIRRPTMMTIGWGVGGFITTLVIFILLDPITSALGLNSTQESVETLRRLPLWILILVAVTAGVTEEIIFRGYFLERLAEASGSLWVGGVLSAIFFTLPHLSQWGAGTLQIGIWAAIVTVFYVKTRDLGATILLHTLNDLFQFIVLPLLLT